MSLINDALKQARKAPPRDLPAALPPPQPVAHEPSPIPGRIVSTMVVVLIIGAIFYFGWLMAHRTVRTEAAIPAEAAPEPQPVTQAAAAAPAAPAAAAPVAAAAPAPQPAAATPAPPAAPKLPKLQGIFYSVTAPSAIVDGKTVEPGDMLGIYRVKTISKSTVTLTGPDKKDLVLGMAN